MNRIFRDTKHRLYLPNRHFIYISLQELRRGIPALSTMVYPLPRYGIVLARDSLGNSGIFLIRSCGNPLALYTICEQLQGDMGDIIPKDDAIRVNMIIEYAIASQKERQPRPWGTDQGVGVAYSANLRKEIFLTRE